MNIKELFQAILVISSIKKVSVFNCLIKIYFPFAISIVKPVSSGKDQGSNGCNNLYTLSYHRTVCIDHS